MAKKELMVVTRESIVATIKNEELRGDSLAILNESFNQQKSAWEVAKLYTTIVDNELFDEDFDSLTEYANFMGVSKTTVSKYTKAYHFVETGKVPTSITLEKAYKLSTLTDEEFDELMKYFSDNDIAWIVMGDNAFNKMVSDWKKAIPTEVATVDATETDVTETPETETTEEATMVEFEVLGKKYRMPQEVLDRYEV